MSNGIPQEFEICWYMRGVDQLRDDDDVRLSEEREDDGQMSASTAAAAVFVVQLPDDAPGVVYTSLGCDEDGVFLMTDNGDKSRINDAAGIECYDDTEDCMFLRLLVLTSRGGHDDEYDITRLPREAALALGA